ncbi:unnamed protein product [Acanthoscelides obtectus]|uniref:Selenoprotein S n=1 Tax=Acanthoscelides obtectus TaxID=200917 RepID=A0A9P0JM86_ACAOB|nr:unnamed protein product [Acanthoscelides obtectus]CAK1634805.1 Selenoprotein S [Acanthoscelides obtectus]
MELEEQEIHHSSNIVSPVIQIFENYGWYILFTTIGCAYVYQNYLKPHIDKFMQKKEEEAYSAKYHKDPDVLVSRLTAQERRTNELQEKYKREAEEYKKKMEEREAKKKEAQLEKLGNEGGKKLGSDKKSFRPEYNPLMGSGSVSSYRPPRRSACSGGGCG